MTGPAFPAPRSAVHVADLELLRVARADLPEPEAPVRGVAGRLRDLVRFSVGRPAAEEPAFVEGLVRRA